MTLDFRKQFMDLLEIATGCRFINAVDAKRYGHPEWFDRPKGNYVCWIPNYAEGEEYQLSSWYFAVWSTWGTSFRIGAFRFRDDGMFYGSAWDGNGNHDLALYELVPLIQRALHCFQAEAVYKQAEAAYHLKYGGIQKIVVGATTEG